MPIRSAVPCSLPVVVACLCFWASPAASQFYTFTSGPFGDGFQWPASPQGLLSNSDTSVFEEFAFDTPDGIQIQNYTGNNLFFDSQYQVASNSGLISGDAMWGNPTTDDFTDVDFFIYGYQSIQFDYAQATAGGITPDSLDIIIRDSAGREAYQTFFLSNQFSGFGGFDGYADTIYLDASSLFDQSGGFEGDEQFVDIDYFYLNLDPIGSPGGTNEFAIDNFAIDGSLGGGDGVFPSFNDGTIDATGTTGSVSVVRNTGILARGIEVTNADDIPTTYSVVREPGGDFTDLNAITDDFLDANASEFTPNVFGFNTNRPSGTYGQDVRVINTGDPTDPDNVTRLEVDVLDLPALSGNFALVNLSANQQPFVANAAAVPNGFRAAIKIDSMTTTGPFTNTGFANGDSVASGEQLNGAVEFDRFGRLSGTYTGTLTVASMMTAYSDGNRNLEVFLANAQPVADLTWNLSFGLGNRTSDSEAYTAGRDFLRTIGINSASTAVTLVGGEASGNRSVSMNFALASDPPEADFAATPFDVTITGGTIDPYVLQVTYQESNLPVGVSESELRVLLFDAVAGLWDEASGLSGSPFLGSFAAFDGINLGTLAQNIGAFGVDAVNNQAWIVLDTAGRFALGALIDAALAGDFNGSGSVEQGDLDLVLNNWGGPRGSWDNVDGLTTPNVDQEELDRVLNNWGASSGSPSLGALAVPEPASAIAVGMLVTATIRRRR